MLSFMGCAPSRRYLKLIDYRRAGQVMPTLFERIIQGELPATIVYRDERVTAFRDIHPRAPTHVLIVPNKPIPTANDVSAADEALLGHMFVVAAQIAAQEGIAQSGYRLIVNCNADGGQEVYHLHVHLLGGRPLGAMVSTVVPA
jgi:histidine triad (HIT) family protein